MIISNRGTLETKTKFRVLLAFLDNCIRNLDNDIFCILGSFVQKNSFFHSIHFCAQTPVLSVIHTYLNIDFHFIPFMQDKSDGKIQVNKLISSCVSNVQFKFCSTFYWWYIQGYFIRKWKDKFPSSFVLFSKTFYLHEALNLK